MDNLVSHFPLNSLLILSKLFRILGPHLIIHISTVRTPHATGIANKPIEC